MTMREIAQSLGKLERTSVRKWEKTLRFSARTVGAPFYITIDLPDGRWFAQISRFSAKADGWAYYIPETREQEERMLGFA